MTLFEALAINHPQGYGGYFSKGTWANIHKFLKTYPDIASSFTFAAIGHEESIFFRNSIHKAIVGVSGNALVLFGFLVGNVVIFPHQLKHLHYRDRGTFLASSVGIRSTISNYSKIIFVGDSPTPSLAIQLRDALLSINPGLAVSKMPWIIRTLF